MGVDLIGHGDERFSFAGWRHCLDVAVSFGWNPAGTIASADTNGDRGGGYCSNDYQEVTDSDAYALAFALLKAIRAREENLVAKQTTLPIAKEDLFWSEEESDVPLLRRLANYATMGCFAIW